MAGISLSASVLSPYLSAQNKKKLGVAVVGFGYYSADLLAPKSQLTHKHFFNFSFPVEL